MKNKVLIFGISSFAGSVFARFMQDKGYLVYGTYNNSIKNISDIKKNVNLKLIKINLEKNENGLLKMAKKIQPTFIIDFSSICMVNESWIYPAKYMDINCNSKINLIKNIKQLKQLKKFIYISTPEIFGETSKPLKENLNLFNPSTPYASTKLFIENLIRNYQSLDSKRFIIARFSNFYGPGQPCYRLIPKLILSIKKNIRFPIHGSGKSKRNYIFSEDFCNGILNIINKGATGRTYHFSSESLYTVKDIVFEICKQMKVNVNDFVFFENDRMGKDNVYKVDSRKTRKELKWKAKVSLKKGINKTINYINNNFEKLKKEKINFKLN